MNILMFCDRYMLSNKQDIWGGFSLFVGAGFEWSVGVFSFKLFVIHFSYF